MRSLRIHRNLEIFVPEIGDGARYKFDVLGHDGVRRLKADPYANATEIPPRNCIRGLRLTMSGTTRDG